MEPLATFTGRTPGFRSARISVYPDRIEWVRPGRNWIANVLLTLLALYTVGLSLLFPSAWPRWWNRSRQMLPVQDVRAVASRDSGRRHTAVFVSLDGQTVFFRLPVDDALRFRQLIQELSHP
ncbi:hypothetical protein ACQEVC_31115 [Plantactinospora sp. CA-294935]|uniref:hypothetical protein n=1 Tax=Plantactinospora sp. CA-294935 TaxID=3240012 RepID=UPI003D90E5AD